jgi:hypothetical protein
LFSSHFSYIFLFQQLRSLRLSGAANIELEENTRNFIGMGITTTPTTTNTTRSLVQIMELEQSILELLGSGCYSGLKACKPHDVFLGPACFC